MRRLFFVIIIFILALILASIFIVLRYVSTNTNTSFFYFPSTILKSFQEPTLAPNFSFIMLGVDPRDDQLEKTQVSDSIMIGKLSPSWQVKLLSIPRDLWLYSLDTKVNQIYPLSKEKITPDESYSYIQKEFSSLTGQSISRTLILTTDNLIELTKAIGGVNVTILSTYTDEQYPNPDYIKDPTQKTPIYKTIIFKKGELHLDETNITEFVRSRKGQNEDGTGGTDTGRIERQQLLLEALINKLKSPVFLTEPSNVLNLYKFWHKNITTNITDSDIFSLLLAGKSDISKINLTKTNIPVGENPKTDILYHPVKFTNKQWVYIPYDSDYKVMQEYISGFLNR